MATSVWNTGQDDPGQQQTADGFMVLVENSFAMMARPQRWDSPFGPDMTDFDVEMLMGLPVIAAMSPERFPKHTPLTGILKNDTRLLDFKAGEIVVREGDYGNSAFLILDGNLRVVLAPNLPRDMIGRQQAKKKNFFQAAAQLWTNTWIPEVRDKTRYADQASHAHGKGAETHVFLQDIPAVLDQYRTAQLTVDALFGELAALGRVPRTASVFAETDVKLLEIRWQGLREIRKYDDSRGGFPDTNRGAVMLYLANSPPIFPQVSSHELMRISRTRLNQIPPPPPDQNPNASFGPDNQPPNKPADIDATLAEPAPTKSFKDMTAEEIQALRRKRKAKEAGGNAGAPAVPPDDSFELPSDPLNR